MDPQQCWVSPRSSWVLQYILTVFSLYLSPNMIYAAVLSFSSLVLLFFERAKTLFRFTMQACLLSLMKCFGVHWCWAYYTCVGQLQKLPVFQVVLIILYRLRILPVQGGEKICLVNVRWLLQVIEVRWGIALWCFALCAFCWWWCFHPWIKKRSFHLNWKDGFIVLFGIHNLDTYSMRGMCANAWSILFHETVL